MKRQPQDPVRRAVAQHLETDSLLGIDALPIELPPAPKKEEEPEPIAQPEPTPVTRLQPADQKKIDALAALDAERVKPCTKCGLCEKRKNTVFGVGHANARLVFVGEAPGAEEDRQGIPFVGPAGQLLTRMIVAMGLSREDVYICNILKCRPPNNRDPAADEIAACSPYLVEQLSIIEPEIIVALGAPAARTLLQTSESIGRLRGRFHDFYLSGTSMVGKAIPLMPTYHPAYLLRSPGEKRKAWADLQMIMEKMDLPAKA